MDECIDLTTLPPTEQVAAHLVATNPDQSKRQLGLTLKQLGLIKHEGSVYHLSHIDDIKKALDLYGHAKVLAPAYGIHAKALENIKEKQGKGEELNPHDAKWVFEAERLKAQQVDVNMPETINHQHLHAILDLKTREYKKVKKVKD